MAYPVPVANRHRRVDFYVQFNEKADTAFPDETFSIRRAPGTSFAILLIDSHNSGETARSVGKFIIARDLANVDRRWIFDGSTIKSPSCISCRISVCSSSEQMTKLRAIRVGIFDQIVSGGGVRFFTTKLVEELSRQAGDRWHFHLMWPFFDSSDNLLVPPRVPHTSFERIESDKTLLWSDKFYLALDDIVQQRGVNTQRHHALLRVRGRATNIRQNEQRNFRSGNGAGLRWLDARMSNFDLVFLPYPYLTLPSQGEWHPSKPVVITLHDLAHEFTDTWGEATMRLRHEMRAWTHLAELVIFSSDSVRREAQKLYGLSADSARTILLAPTEWNHSHGNSSTVLVRYGLQKGYLFTIGWAAKHKRIDTIIRGFALYRKKSKKNIALVIAGPGTEALRNQDLSGLEIGRDVFALGYVTEKDIPALYEHASAVVTASTSEAGLNTVIFDAMMHERAIICSDIPPFVERLGTDDRLAIVFERDNPQALADALLKHFEHPAKAHLRIAEAKRFIAERTLADVAREYLEAFESALGSNRKR